MHRMVLEPTGTSAVPAVASAMLFPFDGLWLGAMVPKRWARRAVTRNLIKRQIYSVAVQQMPALPAAAYLVRLRLGFDRLQFKSAASDALHAAVRREVEHLFAKAARPLKEAA